MGKNRKGKERGKGICQRTDGEYAARFIRVFAAASGLPYTWQDKMAAGHFIKKEYYFPKRSPPREALRHTYATRAIERGMQPKLLGHGSIKTTMDRYVHEQGCTAV